MGCLSNIKKQYFISFFRALIPAYVIERLFWQERGMNIQMVVYAEIIYALTVTLLEVPSGILADRFGRKRMMVIAGIFDAAELVIILFATSFWHFGAAVFLAGVGEALVSGSDNALIYDTLKTEEKQDGFEKLLGRFRAIDFGGYVIAALSGGVLAYYINFEFTYILSVISMCIAFFITLSLKEPPRQADAQESGGGEESGGGKEAGHIKKAFAVFRSQPLVFIYCLTGAVLGACMIYMDEFWQLLAESIGVPIAFFGVVSAVILSLIIPGSLIAYRLKDRFKYNHILTLIIIVSIAGYTAVFFTRNLLCLIPIMLLYLIAGVTEPLVTGYLHHRADSSVRATAESFMSLGLRAISAVVGLVFGYISVKYTIFSGFLVLAVICAGYLAFYRFTIHNKEELA